jgi:DNA-binding protein HU-beta
VNRRDLVAAVSNQSGVERKDVDSVLKGFTDVVTAVVSKGEPVSISGFAKFVKVDRPARMGRNPQTQQPVRIKASKKARITPLKGFKDAVVKTSLAPKLERGVWPPAPAAAKKTTAAKRTTAAKKTTGAKKTTAAKKTTGAKKTTAAKKTTGAKKAATKSTARKAPARKTTATKTTARKRAPAKSTSRPAAKKSTATRPAAKKSTATRPAAKKTSARKTTARKTTAKR